MDEGDRLSLLALIVAVVALIVSSWQLAQQLFATAADGKRFCQGSVMGIWARKTRLSWRWSQVRFETKYTTPDIRLSSGVPEKHLHRSFQRHSGAGQPSQPKETKRLMYRIPFFRDLTEIFNGPSTDWREYFDISATTGDEPWELLITREPAGEIKPRSNIERISLWLLQIWHNSYQEDNFDVVTWPSLVRRIYDNQNLAVTKTQAVPANDVMAEGKTHKLETGETHYKSESELHKEDRVVLRLVERSWDLVPPDVVRPLARSTVGSIIVIGHRFGMQWHSDFNPSNGNMNGNGYGHEISSETIRGLGLVLQYTFREETRAVKDSANLRRLMPPGNYFSPTMAADKLHCGIIPIDHTALPKSLGVNGGEIHLIDPARKVDLDNFFVDLGIPSEVSDKIYKDSKRLSYGAPGKLFKHAVEDAISLLCPIVPLPNSTARSIMWPMRNRVQPFTPLRQRAGVLELRRSLAEFMNTNRRGAQILRDRTDPLFKPLKRTPLEHLDVLLDGFSQSNPNPHPYEQLSDYIERQHNVVGIQGRDEAEINETWVHWFKMNPDVRPPDVASPRMSPIDAMNLYIQLVHQQTSEVIQSFGHPDLRSADADRTRSFLFDLAGAHCTMAAKHGEDADRVAKAQRKDAPDDEVDSWMAGRRRFVRELGRLYVEDLDSGPERAFGREMRRRGYTGDLLKGHDITALWWVLVLRGVCWWMSVQVKLPESQIPSFWYNSQTPVYIT